MIENRIYFSRSEIEQLLYDYVNDPSGFEVEWNDDHSAVLVLLNTNENKASPMKAFAYSHISRYGKDEEYR